MPLHLSKCLKMQERAKGRIPGMTQLLSKRPDMFSLGVWPGYFSKAKGVEVCDLHPWAEMVRYARTGGESMAVAVRIARAHTGKDKIAFCGYHFTGKMSQAKT